SPISEGVAPGLCTTSSEVVPSSVPPPTSQNSEPGRWHAAAVVPRRSPVTTLETTAPATRGGAPSTGRARPTSASSRGLSITTTESPTPPAGALIPLASARRSGEPSARASGQASGRAPGREARGPSSPTAPPASTPAPATSRTASTEETGAGLNSGSDSSSDSGSTTGPGHTSVVGPAGTGTV